MTTPTTDLATVEKPLRARDLDPAQIALIVALAPSLHQARYYGGVASAEQAAWLMARSFELGFPITAGPEVIEAIQGRPTLKPMAAWALVLRSGKLEDMQVEETANACAIRVKRTDHPFWIGYTFTLDAAKKAGLVKPDGAYEKWLPNMLYWRALGFVIDRAFPDVTLGLKDSVQWGDDVPMKRVTTPAGDVIVVAEPGKEHLTVIDPTSGEVLG